MKSIVQIPCFALATALGILLTGCVSRTRTVASHNFILTPMPPSNPAPSGTAPLTIGIGFVKMPSYLLRSSLAVRNGSNEIVYFEAASWAERLDQSFQRTVAVNLSRLLPSECVYMGDSGNSRVNARLFVIVQQFDVDSRGKGTLVVQWKIVAPDEEKPLKNGNMELVRTGAAPRGNPEAIAITLSDLVAEFSRKLAPAILELPQRI